MTDFKVKNRNKRNSQECKFIIELCLSAKIEINFSKENLENSKIEKTENQILIIEKKLSIKMKGWGKVFYGDFCFRKNGKYSNSPFVPKSKVFLKRELSGTPATSEN